MSGRPDSGVGKGGGTENNCDDLRFSATVASPKAKAVEKLVIGQVLDLVLVHQPARLVQVRSGGEVVGAIAKRLAELADCMQKGHDFSATVSHIDGGAITVTIAPR